ncbi:AsmA family protein [Pseudochryseolinea flava]|uniref:DUF748 domain-containing protein n=1 Tax=Pseudochryseolinea flava TaxID=2059302 RepID=A0A364Y3L5_9BACT|nr:DUF748 domain-containing protein [Pseudochryseolinea flava]RAW01400.1 hypothetical protein DQQ10_10890 [Pseudochryseolinea flava]
MTALKTGRRFRWILASVLLFVVIAFFGGRYLLLSKIRDTLHNRLGDLRSKGIYIKFKSAKINTWSGDLNISDLQVSVGLDTTNRDFSAAIPFLQVSGFKIIPFIKNRTISIKNVALEDPALSFRLNVKAPESETRNAFFEDLYINRITITGSSFLLKDSVSQDTIAHVKSDFFVEHLGLERVNDSLAWRQSSVHIQGFAFDLPKERYAFSVKDVRLDLEKHTFEVDTFKMTPKLTRKQFMRENGKEIDYIKAVIPYIKVSGFSLRGNPGIAVDIRKIRTQLFMEVYRDKRLPFIKDKRTTLPSNFVQRLPFDLNIDTLRLDEGLVSYEEFPEKGDSSGAVFFDKLQATVIGISNTKAPDKQTVMHAKSKFMGKGELSVDFTFPADTTKPYTAKGSLKNFPMVKLNDMLGPAAKVRVESGTMTNLKFNFKYNVYRSDGNVELNYEDLRIISLRQNSKKEIKVSMIKTLLLNTFILKKDAQEDDKDDSKTGTILFYRDQKRSIFNYWWKSIFSGIKSAYKIDKLQEFTEDLKKNDRAKPSKR